MTLFFIENLTNNFAALKEAGNIISANLIPEFSQHIC